MEIIKIEIIIIALLVIILLVTQIMFRQRKKSYSLKIDFLNNESVKLKHKIKILEGENKDILKNASIINKLNERIPEGKKYSKIEKIKEFLPFAIELKNKGYDFEIIYRNEIGNYIEDEVVNTEYRSDGMEGFQGNYVTLHFKSGKTYEYYDKEAHFDPDFEMPDFREYVIEQTEQVSIERGNKIN